MIQIELNYWVFLSIKSKRHTLLCKIYKSNCPWDVICNVRCSKFPIDCFGFFFNKQFVWYTSCWLYILIWMYIKNTYKEFYSKIYTIFLSWNWLYLCIHSQLKTYNKLSSQIAWTYFFCIIIDPTIHSHLLAQYFLFSLFTILSVFDDAVYAVTFNLIDPRRGSIKFYIPTAPTKKKNVSHTMFFFYLL